MAAAKAPWSPRPVAPCGTRAAYKRHLAHGETPDAACCAAEAAYRVDYNRRKREAA